MSTTNLPKAATGRLFFVSGITGGGEVFLGRALDEPQEEHLTLEGRSIHRGPEGTLVARPFNTIVRVFLLDSSYSVQLIAKPEVEEEAQRLLASPESGIARITHPYVYRWIEASFQEESIMSDVIQPKRADAPTAGGIGLSNPFFGFYEGFLTTAEQFRRILFHSRQVDSSRELDKVTELEGDLTIEIGKVTNQIAVRLNQIVAREPELSKFFEAFQGTGLSGTMGKNSMAGWLYLMNRLQVAKNWGRRQGKAPLVREVNGLVKDGIFGLNEIILDHCASLDTLITETFAQYGISFEIHGDLSAFAGYTGRLPLDAGEPQARPLIGAGR
jgi:hypothetical protein